MKWLLYCYTLILIAYPLELAFAADSYITAQTENGAVRGKTVAIDDKACHVFLGVPYAEPPVGPLRFMNPVAVKTGWKTARDALQFSPSCPQTYVVPQIYDRLDKSLPEAKENEDCLYLNIYTPSIHSDNTLLPVLVWIHGGGYVMGTGANWHGETLSTQQDIVVVTLNYRLGALGFLAARDNENKDIVPSNNGQLDQKLALEWIQRNIHQFGGDKNKVTIGGNSAGGVSVGLHILSPFSQGLFHSATLQSGTPLLNLCYHGNYDDANAIFQRFLNDTACNGSSNQHKIVYCLQKLSVDQIIQAQWAAIGRKMGPFKPIVDGNLIPTDPKILIDEGKMNKVNVIFGITQNDGTLFNLLIPDINKGIARPVFNAVAENSIEFASKSTFEAIFHRYIDSLDGNNPILLRKSSDKLWTDFYFLAPAVYCGAKFASHGLPTYMYVFSQRNADSFYYPDHASVSHQMEVPYIFGYPIRKPDYFKEEYDEHDVNVSNNMMAMWGSFARGGKPIGNVSWPRYEMNNEYFLNISNNSHVEQHYRHNDVVFWNEVVPAMESHIQKLRQDLLADISVRPSNKSSYNIYKITTTILLFCVIYLVLNIASTGKVKRH